MEREGIVAEQGSCYICRDLLSRLDESFDLISHAVRGYEFDTFLIGVKLPLDILEREDEIRARFKIKGRRGIKNEITSVLGRMLSKVFNARVAYVDPDINIYLDLSAMFVTVRSKTIFLFGRYKKLVRGIEQKIDRCDACNGIGCHTCNFKGSKSISVEGVIASNLIRLYDADNVRFAWVGGEDEDSLVLSGRPFFVKIINPRKRSIDYKDIRIEENGIEAWFTNSITRFPNKAIQFKTRFKIVVDAKDRLDSNLSTLKIDSISIQNRSIKKSIYEFDARLLDEHTLEIELVADSGLPIKRFVEGNGIEPNLSKMLNTELKCRYFDILDIMLEL